MTPESPTPKASGRKRRITEQDLALAREMGDEATRKLQLLEYEIKSVRSFFEKWIEAHQELDPATFLPGRRTVTWYSRDFEVVQKFFSQFR